MKKQYAIIENTEKEQKKFGYNYGVDFLKVNRDDIQKLLDGKCLAYDINGGEYSLFVTIDDTL
jgi:hypothetical protein